MLKRFDKMIVIVRGMGLAGMQEAVKARGNFIACMNMESMSCSPTLRQREMQRSGDILFYVLALTLFSKRSWLGSTCRYWGTVSVELSSVCIGIFDERAVAPACMQAAAVFYLMT